MLITMYAGVSGLNSAASAVRRYTLVRVSDLSDQILRLVFLFTQPLQSCCFLHIIHFLLFSYLFFVLLRSGRLFSCCFCTEIDVYLLVWSIQVFLFANSKCKRYFHNRLKPSKLTWTAMYRKQHKKVGYPYIIQLKLHLNTTVTGMT